MRGYQEAQAATTFIDRAHNWKLFVSTTSPKKCIFFLKKRSHWRRRRRRSFLLLIPFFLTFLKATPAHGRWIVRVRNTRKRPEAYIGFSWLAFECENAERSLFILFITLAFIFLLEGKFPFEAAENMPALTWFTLRGNYIETIPQLPFSYPKRWEEERLD